MTTKQLIYSPIQETNKKCLDHPDHLDRRSILPTWLREEMWGETEVSELPSNYHRTTPKPARTSQQEPEETPQNSFGILPNGDRATPPFETADGHVWRGVLQKCGGYCLERLDIDQPPPDETFDDLPEVMVCPICGGWEHWQSVAGVWRCYACDPPSPKAVQFAKTAAAIRARFTK